jgi:hypothetical protein
VHARLAFTLVALASAVTLLAQSTAVSQYGQFGGWGPGWGYHSSTAAEGMQRGYADVVRSYGMNNLLNSEAAKNWEDARKSYLENRNRATQTYFEMRRYNTEARRAERASPLSMEGYVRLAQQQAPARLSTSQLDPLTGAIDWPAPLQKPEYAAFRSRLEKLFRDRASGFADNAEIGKAAEEFLARLQEDLPKFAANDYLAARSFLTSLNFATRTPI